MRTRITQDEGLKIALNPLEIVLVLTGQPIDIIKDLTLEVDVVDLPTTMGDDVVLVENFANLVPDVRAESNLPVPTVDQGEIEDGEVRETLSEILADV